MCLFVLALVLNCWNQQQVKTTQPRRYLVRPNQGVIAPGGSEVVQILLVEKDKTMLLQSYSTMGETALDHCRDKFLVQSIAVHDAQLAQTLTNSYEELTNYWTQMTSTKHAGIANKKLLVRHTVDASTVPGGGGASPSSSLRHSHQKPIESMNVSEMTAELTNIRTKYDELVSFSVNLTAERDMLNNALEQTKRDLQLAGGSNNKNNHKASSAIMKTTGGGSSSSRASRFLGMTMLCVTAVSLGIVLGAKLHQLGLLQQVPILKNHLYKDEL
jgi:outer membrane murein-binding lipoprotein Lpp